MTPAAAPSPCAPVQPTFSTIEKRCKALLAELAVLGGANTGNKQGILLEQVGHAE